MAHKTQPEWDNPPPRPPKRLDSAAGWAPALNPTQQEIFDCQAKFVLAYGEKGSGKSVGCLHAMVRHCYENKNAFSMLGAITIRTGKDGALYDLENLVLPAWRDGNRYPEWENGVRHPKSGELMDEGIGLEFTPSKQDPSTKDLIIWIGNIHGGWSKVMVVSLPYAEVVDARVRGPAPSFFYMEEITLTSSDAYFKYPAAQLGRRREITGPMQYYASCNPDGPSHWVYKTWWSECVETETGKRDPNFAVFHVPIQENIDRLPPGYVEHLASILKDPIERRRLMNGEWVDRPSGNSIFKRFFMPEIHVIGDALKGIGWKPIKGFPVLVGYDPGPVNFSIHMLQMVPTKQKTIWVAFDELNFVGTYTPYHHVIPLLLKRMDYWNTEAGEKQEFKFIHIADEAAFNQTRSDGSYDSMEIERLGKGRIKLRACPKGKESVVQRVTMVNSMLLEESLFVSATCHKTQDMIRNLASKKPKPGEYDPTAAFKPMRSVYIHPFDSLTYPIFYFVLQPGRFPNGNEPEVKPEAYVCGSTG